MPDRELLAIAAAQPLRTATGTPPGQPTSSTWSSAPSEVALQHASLPQLEHHRCTRPARGRENGTRRGRGPRLQARARLAAIAERSVRQTTCFRSRPIRSTGAITFASGGRRTSTRVSPCGRRARRTTSVSSSRVRNARSRIGRAGRRSRAPENRRRPAVCGNCRGLRAREPAKCSDAADQRDWGCDDDRRQGRRRRPAASLRDQKKAGRAAIPRGCSSARPSHAVAWRHGLTLLRAAEGDEDVAALARDSRSAAGRSTGRAPSSARSPTSRPCRSPGR